MRYLTAEEVLALHCYLMSECWNEPLYGLRDAGLLESAVNRPLTASLYGNADLFDQAARLWEGLVANHPFLQGNKRTAYAAMELFLRLNGWMCDATDEQLIDMCLDLATGRIKSGEAVKWLREHSTTYHKRALK